MRDIIEQLGGFVNALETELLSDASLMEAFLTSHDEDAFAVLVRRHAPMVHGVCRRLLVNVHDVEDAFQATFLILVRRAASVVPREMVGNWLYGVAYRTALKARARTRNSRLREQPLHHAPEPASVDKQEDGWSELRPIIDREIHGLPAKYRAPLVLCEIEGRSYREAAEQIGCP